MAWIDDRLSRRLGFGAAETETLFMTLAEIDAIKTAFRLTDKLLPQTVDRLTLSVIVTSAGASNRIEGNRLNDQEVEALYRRRPTGPLESRDEQEVAGYLEVLELVLGSYEHMPLTEALILQLHRDMLKYSVRDERQRGRYKFGPNRVEAKDPGGNVVGIIFDPTPPHLTPKAMEELMQWWHWAAQNSHKHPLLRIGSFIFEFLAIHPFQDGNGRASRLLTNLLLLQSGYAFSALVSHEKLIEGRKADNYLALNRTQSTWQSETENIHPWLEFFLQIILSQAKGALEILEMDQTEHLLSEKQLALWQWTQTWNKPEFARKDAIEALGFPPRTVEACIKKLLDLGRLVRIGQGRATRYRRKRG
jgi:Fic family protein